MPKYHTTRFGKGPFGCRYYSGTSSISSNVPSKSVVPTTPDGRKASLRRSALISRGVGLTSWGETYLARVRKKFYALARDMNFDKIQIVESLTGCDAGLIGAEQSC